jgi:hypothetical protein
VKDSLGYLFFSISRFVTDTSAFSLLRFSRGAHIYFCGLKGMMPGIQDMLKQVAKRKGLDYEEWLKGLKEKKQWHVEVY